ncbi:hypothetical protein LVJ94_07730 [Pendulispora rubella]|uniref:Uncharacterized protein n=1 Tax=Pendulispora rubella TaxID=2741070 RepID=A0ABZ2LB36_9BACT
MSKPLHELLQELPTTNVTTTVLKGLDYLVPGQWQNITSIEEMIKSVTGEEDQELVQKIGERAIMLYNDSGQGYQRAVDIYQLVDHVGAAAGAASLTHALGESFQILSFLDKITPKPDTAQAIDASVKFVAEMAAFCYSSGLPGDSVGDFAASLANAAKEDAIRFAAWIAFDCIIPLGPDFMSTLLGKVSEISEGQLGENSRFAKIAEYLPGGLGEKKALVSSTLESSREHIDRFVSEKGMSREGLLDRIKGYVDVADAKLDTVAAVLDITTNYFEHTGIQSVARRLVSRAYGEI